MDDYQVLPLDTATEFTKDWLELVGLLEPNERELWKVDVPERPSSPVLGMSADTAKNSDWTSYYRLSDDQEGPSSLHLRHSSFSPQCKKACEQLQVIAQNFQSGLMPDLRAINAHVQEAVRLVEYAEVDYRRQLDLLLKDISQHIIESVFTDIRSNYKLFEIKLLTQHIESAHIKAELNANIVEQWAAYCQLPMEVFCVASVDFFETGGFNYEALICEWEGLTPSQKAKLYSALACDLLLGSAHDLGVRRCLILALAYYHYYNVWDKVYPKSYADAMVNAFSKVGKLELAQIVKSVVRKVYKPMYVSKVKYDDYKLLLYVIKSAFNAKNAEVIFKALSDKDTTRLEYYIKKIIDIFFKQQLSKVRKTSSSRKVSRTQSSMPENMYANKLPNVGHSKGPKAPGVDLVWKPLHLRPGREVAYLKGCGHTQSAREQTRLFPITYFAD